MSITLFESHHLQKHYPIISSCLIKSVTLRNKFLTFEEDESIAESKTIERTFSYTISNVIFEKIISIDFAGLKKPNVETSIVQYEICRLNMNPFEVSNNSYSLRLFFKEKYEVKFKFQALRRVE